MKKNLFYLFALICSMSLFTACSDDDDAPDYSKAIESEIAGDYKGTLDIKLEGTTIASGLPKNITISKAGNSTINLLLANFSLMGMDLGDIELKDCQLSQKDNLYSFTGTQSLNLAKYQLTADVKAVGTIVEGEISVQLDIAAKLNGASQNVQVTYTGTKMSGNESSEALIKTFIFDSELVTEQPIINNETGIITFRVSDVATDNDLKALKPIFTISDKATVSPASGVEQNFSGTNKVTYTVIAENGAVTTYSVFVVGKNTVLSYDFEEWETVAGSMYTDQIYKLPIGGPWGSTNDGVTSIKGLMGYSVPDWAQSLKYAVEPDTDAKSGNTSVVIRTLDTVLPGNASGVQDMFGIPRNTAGSLFLGTFSTDMDDKLASTKFGIEYTGGKPLKFSGWYKYVAGETYRNDRGEIVADKIDKCDIYAVLYEAVDENGQEITLIGGSSKEENKNYVITDSPYVVLKAQLDDKGERADWTYFEIPFSEMNNKSFETNKQYKITFVCTSSEEGATYNGAPGSTLLIDDFKILTDVK
ncbi:PCMD domain-containing protein [Bacteroides clarus]|uniref:PCMD domain-containing protein n=1 Tax=Bacteroides clarus TaxID=626929 RepID=UPI00189B745E|nr:PCMD domain-containing protein [Bacteroides clarus]